MTRFAVTVTLKSGVRLRGECDRFVVRRNVFRVPVEVEWEGMSPQWLMLDVGEVAAIESEPIAASTVRGDVEELLS